MSGSQSGGSSRPLGSPRSARFGVLLVSASLLASLFGGVSARPVLADPAGTALQFNSASSQYVTFGTASPTLGASTFTLEAWIKRTGAGAGTTTGTGGITSAIPLISKGRGEGESPANLNCNYFFGIDASSGKLVADFEDTVNGGNHPVTGNAVIAAGSGWHHVAVTYASPTWNIYVDGALDKTLTLPSAFTPEATSIQHAGLASAMTSTGTAAGFFAGVIDEARIWNVVRSQAEIQASMRQELTSGTGLIGRWGLNDGSGTTAANSIGGSPNGTLTNGPTWVNGFPDDTIPATPTGLTATSGVGQVALSWDANSETDLAGYNVYRSTSSPVTKGTPLNGGSLLTSPAYLDTSGNPGTPYVYAVTAVDTSANESGLSGEATGTPQTPPAGAYALQFDGTNDYVTFGPATSTLGTSTFTLEAWVRRAAGGTTMSTGSLGLDGAGGRPNGAYPVLTKGMGQADTPANVNMNWFLGITATGAIGVDFEDTAGGVNHPAWGTTTVPVGEWHHIAATYGGGCWSIYLDGAADPLNAGATTCPGATPEALSIQHAALATGLNSTGGTSTGYFAGVIDEARVWNVVRSGPEILAAKNLELTSGTGLVGRWGLSEGFGTVAANSIGGSPNGALTNGPTWVAGFVAPVTNQAPVCSGVTLTTNEDVPGSTASSCTDVDGDPLTYSIATQGAKGTAGVSGSDLTYAPTADLNGADSFTYTANDGTVDSAPAGVTVTVDPVNDAPSFSKGADETVDEDTGAHSVPAWATAISAGPADESGQTVDFLVTGNDNPALFSVAPAVSAAGTLSYTLAPGASGVANITLVLHDDGATANGGVDTSAPQTFSINVGAVNHAPVCSGVTLTTNEDVPGSTASSCTDVDGDPLTYGIATQGAKGTAGVSGSDLTYAPTADLNGADSFTYTANDGTVDSAPAGVTVTVDPVNDAPSFTKGANQAVDDDDGPQSVTAWATAISAGPADEAGQALDFQVTGNDNAALFSALPTVSATGTLTYTPALGASGVANITLVLHDDGGVLNGGADTSAPQTFSINVNAVNHAPVCSDVTLTTNEDVAGSTAASCTDVDGDTLTYSIVAQGTKGTAGVSVSNLTYTPTAQLNGADAFTYKASDGFLDSNTANAAVTINAVNDVPSFAKGADQTVGEDSGAHSVSGWATAISAGPADESGQAVDFVVTTDNNALFSALPAVSASGTLTYTPAANANGSATVTVSLHDNGGGVDTSADQTFTITVSAVNDAPSFTKGANEAVNEDAGPQSVLGWAFAITAGPNESGQAIDFIVTNDNNALFSAQPAVSASGTLTYTPAADAYGSATVTVSLHDSGGTANGGVDTSAPQTLTITVNAVNDVPSFTKGANQSVAVDSGPKTVTGWATAFSAGPANESGQALDFIVTNDNNALFLAQPAVGSTGTLTFTPATSATGSATVTVRIHDDGGTANGGVDTSAPQTFTITVSNQAIDFGSGSAYVTFGDPAKLDLAQFTIETWFKRTGAGTGISSGTGGITLALPLVTHGSPEGDGSNIDADWILAIDDSTDVIAADFEDMATGANHPVYGTTTIVNDTWYHAAVTYDGTTWRLYLNGNLEATLAVNQTPRSDTIQRAALATMIRSDDATRGHFQGVIDEARVWSTARTRAQIVADINGQLTSGPGLAARWGLNEGSGTSVADSITPAANGTITNTGYAWVTGAPFDLVVDPNEAPDVNAGPDQSIVLPAQATLDGTVTDDGLPNPPALVTTSWSKVSGPGTVTFGNASAVDTTATFSASGSYVLRLTANDSAKTASDDITITVSPTPAATALQFNGTNQYVTFGTASGLTAANFTLETWFKWTGGGTSTTTGTGGIADALPLIAKGAQQSDGSNVDINYFMGIQLSTGKLVADFEEGAGGASPGLNHPVASTATITTNVWHHAAATYDGTTWNLYLDGANVGTLAVGQPVRSDSIGHAALATSLNSTGATNGFFAGAIDEARIWNVARTGPQILAAKNLELTSGAGLLGRWGLNEGTGSTATDSVAPLENGTLTNGPVWVSGAPFTSNAAPAAPVVVSPANGATGVSTSPTLDVTVSDLDGDTLDATFYGRAAGGAAPDFTLVTIPDTQYYSQSYPATFTAQTTWIRDAVGSLNTVFVTHLGDITETGAQAQWDNADASMDVLDNAGVPNGLVYGNHDTANLAAFDATFPVSRYSANSWYGGSMPGKANRDSYQLFSVGGLDFVILHLEYSPDASVQAWASGILAANASRRAIVVIHDYLDAGSGNRSSIGTTVWNTIVSPNCNVFLVLSGHSVGENRLASTNSCGGTVNQVVQDYQGRSNGGDGWLRYYTFKPSENKVYAHTWKVPQGATPGSFETDANSQFTLDYTMSGGGGAFTLIGTDTDVASGGHATVAWPGRAQGTQYEWYVDVSDGSLTTTGPTWSFTTVAPANNAPVCSSVTLTTNEDTLGSTAPSCTDADGQSLTYSIVAQGTKGSAGVASGQLRYTPTANQNGADSFTYKASDGLADSNTATVSVTINPVNDAPSFTKGADQTVDKDSGAHSVTGWASAISAGPADESAQTVDFLVSNSNNALFSAQPAIGPTGTLTFTPATGATGSATVTVRIHDTGGVANGGADTSAPQTFFVTVSAPGDVVLVGAGDIADGGAGAGQTAALIAALPAATVFTVGDNAYPEGTASDFATKYDPTWGPFKARTHPSVGNHDWTNRNAGFFPYFGAANVGSPNGYYSYDLGAFWHVIVLNTEIAYGAGSTQELWLRADLAANASKNVVAYFHRPRFSSDNVHGTEVAAGAIWDALYEYGADLVLNGHAHWFERFAPQTPAGVADATHGIRQLTCGTGGGSRYALGTLDANSEVHDGSTWGVCKITLHETSYDWQFIPVAGGGFTDSGTTAVHAAPAVNHAPTIDLSAPADGATGVSLDPTLDAVPSDVDGDSLDVTFYGRTAGGGAGSVGIVQDIGATSNSTAGQTATVLSVSKTVTTGNMIVVGFAYFAGQGAEAVTDDLGNTYTRVERADNAGVATGSLWYAPVTAGGALTSITATHPASGDNVIQAVELSAGTLSAAGGGDAGLGTAATWAASRTIPANGLAIGFASTNGSTAHSAGPASGSPSTAITMHRYYQGASSLESSFVSAAAGSTAVTGFTGTTTFASMYFVSAGAIFTPANPWSLVGTDTGVASGAHAVVAWPGRAADTVYEWYATVSDGVLSAPSPTRSFTTGGGGPATGFLRVTSSPALPTQISIDGVIADSWGLNWLKLAPGSYTVSFSHIEGFTEPAPQVVIVTAGATTTVTGTFTARGTLRVITDPAVAGRIVVDGVPRNQWGLWTDLPAGVHQVCFGPVAGFDPPACEDVTLTAGVLSPVTGTYTANAAAPGATGVGFLRVTSDPAVRTQISIDGVIADSWGLTWVELAPGPHTVSFSHVEGFTEPAPVVVTVTDGAITTLAGTFVARGSLRVITSPAVAGTITVDGIPRNDWGMWTDLPVGMHTVCFGAVPGFTAPACQNPTLTAGALSTVTGTYTP